VKNSVLISLVLLIVSGTALAEDEYPLGQRSIFSDRAIEERIRPVGSVCVEGEDCATQVAAADSGGNGGSARSGSAINDQYCSTCHASGAAGAPVLGDKAAWAPRIDKGMDTLVKHAWEGFKGMPAKGTCMECSAEQIRATVKWMLDQSGVTF